MKLPMLSVVVACLPFISGPRAICQQQTPQSERPFIARTESPRLYFSWMPTEHTGFVELSALDAQLTFSPEANLTSADIESVLQLRGNVQVRMCAPSGHGCEMGSLLLRADAVDFNEKTREIDAHGDVRIIPDTSTSRH
jgi:lipopolysaccharide assembly outer membrane protein LptD (OstA)